MFFAKEEKPPITKPEKIAIIGDSPLAFFLQAYFLNSGYECKLLLPVNQADFFRKLGTLTVRSPFMQPFRYKPEIITSANQKFDFYFLVSSAESCRSDIFFLPTEKEGTFHIINLSGFYNHRFINHKTNTKIINGFTNPHLTLNANKSTLDVFDKDITFFLSAETDTFFNIGNLFSSPSFIISSVKNFPAALWQNLCIYFTTELLLATSPHKISDSLQNTKFHTQLSGIINELKLILQQNKIQINEGEILSSIYAIPNDYLGTAVKKIGFVNFSNIFSGINADTTPKIYNLLMQMSKKYMA